MNGRNEQGIALVITLLVLTLLITLILEFNNSMRVEARAAANFRDDLRAYYLARAGVTFARALLEEDAKSGDKYDALTDLWAQKIPPIPVGDGFVSVEITDEDSKINVSKAYCGSTLSSYQKFIKRFIDEVQNDDDLSGAIADWIDQDNNECPTGGAESADYRGLDDPYEAKNALFDSLEEVRLVEGMDDELFRKLNPYLTIINSGVVNINTAPVEVLTMLDEDRGQGELIAQLILDCRKDEPFKDPDKDVETCLGEDLKSSLTGLISIQSGSFSIVSTGDVNGVRKIIRTIVQRNTNGITTVNYWRTE